MDDRAGALDPGGHLAATAGDCVHCGFCLPACPTYQLWGEEMDSPRGRIHLISQVLEGAPVSEKVTLHLDRCLGCMACVTACPSGVRYNELIEAARTWPEQPGSGTGPVQAGAPRSVRDRAVRAAIFATFPYPKRLRALSGPLRAAQRAGFDRLVQRGPVARYAPEIAGSLRLAPRSPGRQAKLPARIPARGERRAVVGMLTGCVQQVFFPHVNAATARVLAAEGCDVIVPPGQGCCGALSLHAGRADEAAGFAERTIAEFESAGVDAIVINSAGCGSAMKEYGAFFARAANGEPGRLASRAAAFSGRVRDFSEFLASLYRDHGGPRAVRHELKAVTAYHDACHLAHAQRNPAAAAGPAGRHPGPGPDRGRRRRSLLRVGGHLQPGTAGGGRRTGPAQGRGHPGDRGAPCRIRQSRLQPADRGRDGRRWRRTRARGAHRRGARRLLPRAAPVRPRPQRRLSRVPPPEPLINPAMGL